MALRNRRKTVKAEISEVQIDFSYNGKSYRAIVRNARTGGVVINPGLPDQSIALMNASGEDIVAYFKGEKIPTARLEIVVNFMDEDESDPYAPVLGGEG